MTPDEIAAERWACREWLRQQSRWQSDSEIWLARAEIARAEQAELREKYLRLAKMWLRRSVSSRVRYSGTSKEVWDDADPFLRELAEEAGVWFDDDGNEVPLAEWRARMGGVR